VKQETFLRPYAVMKPHLDAHRAWVEQLRQQGVVISSGLLLLEAPSYAEAEALVHCDPMVISGGVDWRLQQWRPSVGDLGVR
jgi:uncharacterized protein YciI